VPEWAARISVRYVDGLLKPGALANLLAAAGLFIGVGDGRGEKGALSYGQFEMVKPDDEAFERIMKTGGRQAQLKALIDPDPYDDETAELWGWFVEESHRRELKITQPGELREGKIV
jgi:hypothetical protein